MRLPLLTLLLTAAAVAASVAHAANPGEGKVSASSPSVSWKGQVVNSGVTNQAWTADKTAPCEAPSCDSFKLTVEDSANLLIKLKGFAENRAGGDPTCGIRITHPSGEQTYDSNNCGPKTEMKVTIKNAPKGAYVIDVADSHVVSQPEDYEASATLAVAPQTVSPPVSTTPPTANPQPPAQPGGSAPKLTVKVPVLSARKLKKAKRFTVTLTTDTPLSGVNGVLVGKKKQIGSGSLAAFQGTAKLVVKLKGKLKKGTYQLGVGGRDAQGTNVVASAKVKVKK
jgi:hypothetical protein